MIEKLSPSECVLCGGCIDACPTGAISFQKAYLDFCYPAVDLEKCVSCGLCEKTCPVLAADAAQGEKKPQPQVYAAKNPDADIRRNSSSGGVFRALAEQMLERGGYVCGAVFNEDFRVHHIVSNQEMDIRRMMGSKYAQSDLRGVYKKIKALLRNGEMVLFTGCPCQVAALRSFLGKHYENLITADFICHGGPSDTMLRAYLDLQEKKNCSKVETLCFRDKKHGWHRSSVRIRFENGAEYCKPITSDAYMNGFLGGIFIKESCYSCQFKNFRSGSDLTLADFWGAEAELTELDDNTGLSAVLANTGKGDAFLRQCEVALWEENLDMVVKCNRNLIASTKRNPIRDSFYQYAEAQGHSAAIKTMLWEHPIKMLYREGRYLLRCMVYTVLGRGKPLY